MTLKEDEEYFVGIFGLLKKWTRGRQNDTTGIYIFGVRAPFWGS